MEKVLHKKDPEFEINDSENAHIIRPGGYPHRPGMAGFPRHR
jgi:hypothetical protein